VSIDDTKRYDDNPDEIGVQDKLGYTTLNHESMDRRAIEDNQSPLRAFQTQSLARQEHRSRITKPIVSRLSIDNGIHMSELVDF